MGTVRLLLAVSVAVQHYNYGWSFLVFKFVDITSAVEAFFVISGFYITYILNENPSYRNTRNFYLSRYTRLLPTYAAIVLLSLLLTPHLVFFRQYLPSLQFSTKILIVFANLSLFFQDCFHFFEINYQTGALQFTDKFSAGTQPPLYHFLVVPQAWSLGVELTFYLIAPFIVRSPVRLSVVLLLSAGCRYLFYTLGLTWDPWLYRVTAGEMMLFAAGGLSYFAARDLLKGKPSRNQFLLACGGWIVIIVLCAARNLVFSFPIIEVAYPVMWESLVLNEPILLLLIALFTPLIFFITKNSRVDAFFGDLSYPVYLSHLFVATVLGNLFVWKNPAHATLAYILITFVASTALIYLVEKPVKLLRAKRFGAR